MESEGYEQYGRYMVCPLTDIKIPKTLRENLEWRKKVRTQANDDLGFRKSIKEACAQSIYFWLNAFGWTFLQKRTKESGVTVKVPAKLANVPFITWRVQDEALESLIHTIENGGDALINKSRDMGASWLCLAVFHWYWQFYPNNSFLEMSRAEKWVDKKGDMDSLFEKHRYLIKKQPVWLRPKNYISKKMLLLNQDMNSRITGETTNKTAGQGGRAAVALLDEFARMPNATNINLSLSDTVATKIFNSTPEGAATEFTRLYKSGIPKIIELPWYKHPDKGLGAKLIDAPTANIGYKCPAGKKYVNAFYLNEERQRSPKDLAQNVDMCHGRSGKMFFDADVINQHRISFEKDPLVTGGLMYVDQGAPEHVRHSLLKAKRHDKIRFTRMGSKQNWRFWAPFIDGRLNQEFAYTLGVDISTGTGVSNSVITVYNADTKQVVAKFWSANVNPYQLVEECIKAGVWIGGRTGLPILSWEANGGVGAQFKSALSKIGYNRKYKRRDYKAPGDPVTNKFGWHSDDVTKEDLLGKYESGLSSADIINPCKESIDECLDYMYDDNGKLVPGSANPDESSGARATHGDHCIADAIAYEARKDVPKRGAVEAGFVKGSYMARKLAWKRKKEKEAAWS